MTLNALIAVLGLAGFLFLITAIRRFRLRHMSGGLFPRYLRARSCSCLPRCVFLIGANLRTYQRLTAEAPAGEIQFAKVGAHQYNGVLTYPDGEVAYFPLSGDEWQIDARILKWTAIANLVGFDTAFRLERISGRYSNIEDERYQPRTVYELHPPGQHRPVAAGARLPSLAALVRRALRQRHIPAHGRRSAVRHQGISERPGGPPAQRGRPQRRRQLALIPPRIPRAAAGAASSPRDSRYNSDRRARIARQCRLSTVVVQRFCKP